MSMRPAYLLALAQLAGADAAAHNLAAEPQVSAQTILVAMRSPPGAGTPFDRTAGQWADFDRAQGYMRGVKDSTAGWCPGRMKLEEVDGELLSHLARLPLDQQGGPAAPAIAAGLRRLFPCPRTPGAPHARTAPVVREHGGQLPVNEQQEPK